MGFGGFSWKRATGVTRMKSKVSRATGVPLTKSGRQRKVGNLVTGGGCLIVVAAVALTVGVGGGAAAWSLSAQNAVGARVISVADGDTLKVLVGGGLELTVRIWGIDAPEVGADLGERAKARLSELALDRDVWLTQKDTDRFGRTVARVVTNDVDLGVEMVRDGLAWHYDEYAPGDLTLASAEVEARTAGRNIWSLPNPLPPWEEVADAASPGPDPLPSGVVLQLDRESEEVHVTNSRGVPLALAGWALVSTGTSDTFIFPDVVLQPGDSVTVASGPDARHDPPRIWRWPAADVWTSAATGELRDTSDRLVARSETNSSASRSRPTPPAGARSLARVPTPSEPVPVSGVTLSVDLRGEVAYIVNGSSEPVSLAGWTLISLTGGQNFSLPDVVLEPGKRVDITSGPNASHVPPYSWRWTGSNVWNNDGDPGELWDANGQLVATSTNVTSPPNASAVTPSTTQPEPRQVAPPPARRSTRRCGAICRDGSRSSATGRGACSHHGGVARWVMCDVPQSNETLPLAAGLCGQ